jgi:hypothetical protein
MERWRPVFLLLACTSLSVDPDNLPSIEVLLVPPKHPFPQVEQEIGRLRSLREATDAQYVAKIQDAYDKANKDLLADIETQIRPIVNRLVKDKPFKRMSESLLQHFDNNRNVENLVIRIHRQPRVDLDTKQTISDMQEKLIKEEKQTLDQAVKEFSDVAKVLKRAVKENLTKYFSRGGKKMKSAFVQKGNRSGTSGIGEVLNVRVGSSSVGDGLLDGASYPSVLGLVNDEIIAFNSGDTSLLNTILYRSRQIGINAVIELERGLSPIKFSSPSSFLDPSNSVARAIKQQLQYLPPAIVRVWRERAFQHATMELDIHPPSSDDEMDEEMLNAMLKSEESIRKARVKSYLKAKAQIIGDFIRLIEWTIRDASIAWNVTVSPDTVPFFSLNELLFKNISR